jgi:DNA-binding MarR family transcriptional regulator
MTPAKSTTPNAPLRKSSKRQQLDSTQLDLRRYTPALFTWIANKLSSGASANYLKVFGVGIESWRCLVLLAIESPISAQKVCRVICMDKASVSRCFKRMHDQGLITISANASNGRAKLAHLTPKGRSIHNENIGLALERERAFLSVLDPLEQDLLIGFLNRLHDNLPEVELRTDRYVTQRRKREKTS